MARHIRHYPLQSYNFKPRRQILTVRSYIQIHLTPPPLWPVCLCAHTRRLCGTPAQAPLRSARAVRPKSTRFETSPRMVVGVGRAAGTRPGAGRATTGAEGRRRPPGPAGAETDAGAGRRDERSSGASRPLLKIASVSDLMRFVMIVGDSRRRNFELSGLKVRPGARAPPRGRLGWSCSRDRPGRHCCARVGSGTDARGICTRI